MPKQLVSDLLPNVIIKTHDDTWPLLGWNRYHYIMICTYFINSNSKSTIIPVAIYGKGGYETEKNVRKCLC